MSDSIIQLKIMHEVAIKAEHFYDKAETLGKLAAENMAHKEEPRKEEPHKEEKGRHRSQITGLENVANNALKVTDVLDYLKTQTARKKEWQLGQLGQKLLELVNVELRRNKEEICGRLSLEKDSYEGIQVHLYLIREFVRQFAAQYEYSTLEAPKHG